MAQDRIITEVQGVVACSNERGLKLVGGESWVNFSKFGSGRVPPPAGSIVILGLDKAGYIREISTGPKDVSNLDTSFGPEGSQISNLDTANGAPVDRETRITRSACLNTAVNILMSNGAVKLGEVLDVAIALESWVTR